MLDAELAMFGAKRRNRDVPDEVEVEPSNMEAVEVFVAMNTQWRYSSMGSVVGLDYNSLSAAVNMMGVQDVKDVFWRVRVLEHSALRVIQKRQQAAEASNDAANKAGPGRKRNRRTRG